jgi:hypothetical protein
MRPGRPVSPVVQCQRHQLGVLGTFLVQDLEAVDHIAGEILAGREPEILVEAVVAFFKGTCTRGIYDNMKTAVEAVFIGKDRQYNRRFLRMCGHYLVEPVACTPASGWEKGQVENQVGLVRERFFTRRLRVASYEELNAWLLDRCVAYAKAHKHPELADCTIRQAFEAERPSWYQSATRSTGPT